MGAPLIRIIRTVIDSFSEAQGPSHVRVQTAEPANWSKEVLDCRPAAGVQITLLNKAAHLLTGEYKKLPPEIWDLRLRQDRVEEHARRDRIFESESFVR